MADCGGDLSLRWVLMLERRAKVAYNDDENKGAHGDIEQDRQRQVSFLFHGSEYSVRVHILS